MLAGEVVDAHGDPIDADTAMPPARMFTPIVTFPTRSRVPFDVPVIFRDENIVVVDKPHFLATMPRGRHVAQTALVPAPRPRAA